jgi:uncharacterized protein (TIGR02996 family)
MSDTRSALEAALAATPDDAALHAAYADLLIEQGDPRGEYIRLQLALEDPGLRADRRADLWRRQYDLWKAHAAAWAGPLARHPAGLLGGWRRGWVHSVRAVRVTPGLFALLATAPEARLVRHLNLSTAPLGDDGVDELIASGLIARLDTLDLTSTRITDDGAEALARCPDVPRLKALHLERNLLSPIGIGALRQAGMTVSGRQFFGPGGED